MNWRCKQTIPQYFGEFFNVVCNSPPVPPSVKDGRIMAGKPIVSIAAKPSSTLVTKAPRGISNPQDSTTRRNSIRSSARRIARRLEPISSTPYRSRTPDSASSTARFKAVCPPIVGRRTSGRSRAIIFSIMSAVRGSM